MAQIEHRLSNGQDFQLCITTGTVLSTAKDHKLTISQGATTVLPQGTVIAGGMRSSTRTSQEVWIRTVSGKEEAVVLDGFSIPLREGQRITVVSGAPLTINQVTVFGVKNHATDQVEASVAPLRALGGNWKLDVGSGASVARWALVPAAVVGCLILFNTQGDQQRLMYTLIGAAVAALIGVSAWLNVGRGIGVEARGEALLAEVKSLGLTALRKVE